MKFKKGIMAAAPIWATAALATAVFAMQSEKGNDTIYLPTANSAIAMQAIGAAEGLNEIGFEWSSTLVEQQIARVDPQISPRAREAFQGLKDEAREQAINGGWTEEAISQYLNASRVGLSSVLLVNKGVVMAEGPEDRQTAENRIFEQYSKGDVFAGIGMIQMAEVTLQIQEMMEACGVAELVRFDPDITSHPNFFREFDSIISQVSIGSETPLEIESRIADRVAALEAAEENSL